MLSTRYPCRIFMRLEYSRQIFEKAQISNFVKIRSVGAEWFNTDGQDEANSRFRNFSNATKS
jgi:hypothetical protein